MSRTAITTRGSMENVMQRVEADIQGFADQLLAEGMPRSEVVRRIHRLVQHRRNSFYQKHTTYSSMKQIVESILKKAQPDSKIEIGLYNLLAEAGIPFEFQYSIGRYRADYLIGGHLIVELDGPQHEAKRDDIRDKYLSRLGYTTIRVPTWLLTLDPEAVVEEIKERANTKKRSKAK